MNTDSFIAPVWQLRVNSDGVIPKTAKYHCFVEDDSLCGGCHQDTSFFDKGITTESAAVLELPHLACSRCLKKWKQMFCV